MSLSAGKVIGIMITMVIGVSLIATVATEATTAQADGNVTGATSTLTGIVPIIFVAILIAGASAYVRSR